MPFIPKPIRSEKEYEEALRELEPIFEAKTGTPEGKKSELLSILIEDYEDRYYLIGEPDLIEAIFFIMEQRNMTVNDLGKIIDYNSRASEILNRKRKLT